MARPDNARITAVALLTDVTGNAKLLSDLTLGPKFLALSAAERARAQRLARECLRALERADRILNAYLQKKPLPPEAKRALAEAEERRKKGKIEVLPKELGGRDGPEPVRYGDWERKGIAIDF